MHEIRDIVDDTQSAVLRAIEAAYKRGFEAGKQQGERDAAVGLKARLSAILSDDAIAPDAQPQREYAVVNEQVTVGADNDQSDDDTGRAAPGTVKPTILSIIANSQNGMLTREVVSATGFKPNSVRGTLWTLHNEGSIEKADSGRWVAAPSVREAAKSEALAAYQEAARNSEAPTGKPEGAFDFNGEGSASPVETQSRQSDVFE